LKIEDIEKEWKNDSRIDLTDLNESSTLIPELHSKYFSFLNQIKGELRNLSSSRKKLYLLKSDYYNNQLAPQQMKELGWSPNKRIILKGDLDKWIEADEDFIQLNLEMGRIQDIKEFLEDIIQNINRRGFIIKNIIEHNKFMMGIN